MKYFCTYFEWTACLLLAFFVFSCNSRKTPSDLTDTLRQDTKQSGAGIPSINLYTLSAHASLFTSPPRKNIVFVHYFTDSSITLRGWLMRNTNPNQVQFDSIPDIGFTEKDKASVAIGPGTYIGNQVLLRRVVNNIDSIIGGQKATLLFVPNKDATGKLYYKIRIVFTNQELNKPDLPEYQTNPSPPHQSFD